MNLNRLYVYFVWVLLLNGCSNAGQIFEQKTKLMRAWDHANNPERMGLTSSEYEFELSQLPLQAYLNKKPWSDGYWPSYKGGLSYRWNYSTYSDKDRIYYPLKEQESLTSQELYFLSPSEKYDVLLNQKNYDFTLKERRRTKIMNQQNGEKIPIWYGLCHGWAAASLLFEEPSPVSVTREDGLVVRFGSSDIKALLTYFLHKKSGHTYFVSKRCNIDDKELRKQRDLGVITHEDYRQAMDTAACRGINAGSFHVILSNLVGLRDEGFLVDITRGSEIWNQPVHGYKSEILATRNENFSPQAAPETVQQVKIQTKMYYTVEIPMQWEKSEKILSSRKAIYTYWLELDQNKNIIGGTWISEERPDFLWNRTFPKFDDKYKVLEDLYKKSIEVQTNQITQTSEESPSLLKEMYFRKHQTSSSTKIYARGLAAENIKKVYIYTLLSDGRTFSKKRCFIGRKRNFVGTIRFKTGNIEKILIVALDENENVLERTEHQIASL